MSCLGRRSASSTCSVLLPLIPLPCKVPSPSIYQTLFRRVCQGGDLSKSDNAAEKRHVGAASCQKAKHAGNQHKHKDARTLKPRLSEDQVFPLQPPPCKPSHQAAFILHHPARSVGIGHDPAKELRKRGADLSSSHPYFSPSQRPPAAKPLLLPPGPTWPAGAQQASRPSANEPPPL